MFGWQSTSNQRSERYTAAAEALGTLWCMITMMVNYYDEEEEGEDEDGEEEEDDDSSAMMTPGYASPPTDLASL